MPKSSSFIPLGMVLLNQNSPVPLYRQLYEQLQSAILSGQLPPGVRLPSTRKLAEEWNISRNTVMNAFEQLIAEGYIEGKIGAGSYVSPNLPDDILQLRIEKFEKTGLEHRSASSVLSKRGVMIANIPTWSGNNTPQPFRSGVPALDSFPFKIWKQLLTRHWRKSSSDLLRYGQPAGYRPLREAIASYLGIARGVRCDPEQVIIVTGSQKGINLTAHMLLDPGDKVWVEDPGYPNARRALLSAGANLIPVPVDREGIDIKTGMSSSRSEVRMAYVTPSYQYPLGINMSLPRRLKLLEWANQANAWILEDDYDSEYRYTGHPLAALQGLDQAGRVIYIGTFSKVLFPSLRLGYMIVPLDLIDLFVKAMEVTNRGVSTINQAVLADFITEGHFARHIRRMRILYAERQSVLVERIQSKLAGALEVSSAEAGLHLIGWLSDVNDRIVSDQLASHGIYASPLSAYASEPMKRQGLLLGYAGIDTTQIKKGVDVLEKILRTNHHS